MSLWRKRQIQSKIDAITSADPFNRPAKKVGTQTSIDNESGNHYIRGEMVIVMKTISELQQMSADPNFVSNLKFDLASQLGVELLKHGCVEFTSADDMAHMSKTIRARCFVVPSEDVQLLREKGF
jgi:hypothetical protein